MRRLSLSRKFLKVTRGIASDLLLAGGSSVFMVKETGCLILQGIITLFISNGIIAGTNNKNGSASGDIDTIIFPAGWQPVL